MAVTTGLTTPHRTVFGTADGTVDGIRQRHGDVRTVHRSPRIEPLDVDASELDDLTPLPAASTAEASDILMLDDRLFGPALREGTDDEGVGGYQR